MMVTSTSTPASKLTLEHIGLIDGLDNALGFLYTATEDTGIPFDSFLETVIKRSLDLDPRRYEVDIETSVRILPPESEINIVKACHRNSHRDDFARGWTEATAQWTCGCTAREKFFRGT